MNETGSVVRTKRLALGLSQARFAELTKIPQHVLSSFELGKTELDATQRQRLGLVFSDEQSINTLIKRKKRYQGHRFEVAKHDPSRRERHTTTSENIRYRALLDSLASSDAPKEYKAISLFSGCGGLSFGFSRSRFRIAGFVEADTKLAAIYQQNFCDTVQLGADITEIGDESIRASQVHIGHVDAIIGGPPCQGFSLSGKRNTADPRNTLFKHYLRFVDVYRPKVAVMENVRLLTSMRMPNGKFAHEEMKSEFQARGYRIEMFIINAKDYGVPQHRERVFFIGVREDLGIGPSFPLPTHGGQDAGFLSLPPQRTFADACSDLAFLENGQESSKDKLHSSVAHPQHVVEWLWDVPEGSSAHDNVDPAKRPPSGYNTTYKRQVWLEPGSTVQTTFGMISGCRNVHPIATRALTIREAARLQSFPDSFRFDAASLGTIRTGIGNAVPPLLAHAVAEHIALKILKRVEVAGR